MAQIQARTSGLDKNTKIVVLCRSGRRNPEIAKLLQTRGFQTINLAGGILAWSQNIDPGIPTY